MSSNPSTPPLSPYSKSSSSSSSSSSSANNCSVDKQGCFSRKERMRQDDAPTINPLQPPCSSAAKLLSGASFSARGLFSGMDASFLFRERNIDGYKYPRRLPPPPGHVHTNCARLSRRADKPPPPPPPSQQQRSRDASSSCSPNTPTLDKPPNKEISGDEFSTDLDGCWGTTRAMLSRSSVNRLLQVLSSRCGISKYSVLLDINCGTGLFCLSSVCTAEVGTVVGVCRDINEFQCCLMNLKVLVEERLEMEKTIKKINGEKKSSNMVIKRKENVDTQNKSKDKQSTSQDSKSDDVSPNSCWCKVDSSPGDVVVGGCAFAFCDSGFQQVRSELYDGATHVFSNDAYMPTYAVEGVVRAFLRSSSCRVLMTFHPNIADRILLPSSEPPPAHPTCTPEASPHSLVLVEQLPCTMSDKSRTVLYVYLRQLRSMGAEIHRNRDRKVMERIRANVVDDNKPARRQGGWSVDTIARIGLSGLREQYKLIYLQTEKKFAQDFRFFCSVCRPKVPTEKHKKYQPKS
eukprot:GHVS01034870.1.p1 GENE.GHVS01034870.1~~GHVS01034870.1.p1  ORF type:complete len:517 (-),score=90.27 GHVS01034870.1:778-2328(-)